MGEVGEIHHGEGDVCQEVIGVRFVVQQLCDSAGERSNVEMTRRLILMYSRCVSKLSDLLR